MKLTTKLFTYSEERGKESSGIAIKNFASGKIEVLKHSVPAKEFIRSGEYLSFFNRALDGVFHADETLEHPFAVIAHARLVTNGTRENNNNNQPVIRSGMVAVHNGIITNVDELWQELGDDSKREFEVDTEVMLALTEKHSKQEGLSTALLKALNKIKGTVSTCVLSSFHNEVPVLTNNGSIYYVDASTDSFFAFASERYILKAACAESDVNELASLPVQWMKPGSGLSVNPHRFNLRSLDLPATENEKPVACIIENHSPDKPVDFQGVHAYYTSISSSPLRKLLEFNIESISKLKRCSKCLLPETFPFIRFGPSGVCNYCDRYVLKKQGSRKQEFLSILGKHRSNDGSPDCIVPFSGGRDSSYGLHYIVKELGMHPITYTYDWGMVTDLARRNIARVCGKLGIENIIVSADIAMKRKNIKLNVNAWLKRPSLGIIPLFMAGDKQFFSFVNQVKRQTGVPLDIWSTNQLETTDFKTGFCGVSPNFDKTRPDYLSTSAKLKMASYYLKEFALNPGYINISVLDTIKSFYAYYAEPRTNFYQLFDWIEWREDIIEQTLFNEYEWELAPDTVTSWRIGDGTAPFYNYIYYTVAGFSEFDTFRSNQIREGLISREEGLKRINEENKPRFESMHWYFETIGIDFERAVKVVNAIPKLYPHR